MKKVIVIAALLVAMLGAKAQNPIAFEYVIQKEGATAEQIYNALVDWIVSSFQAVDGDFYRDKEEKMITKDVMFRYDAPRLQIKCYNGEIRYKLKFQCRDGRFKMTCTNFCHKNDPGNHWSCILDMITDEEPSERYAKEVWQDIKNKAEIKADDIKNQLEQLQVGAQGNDDW